MGVLCVVPVLMGLILVAAAVYQKTGTSDVQSWPSSTEDDDVDPYEQMQAEQMAAADDEDAVLDEMEYGEDGLTRPAHADNSDMSDQLSQYTYDY